MKALLFVVKKKKKNRIEVRNKCTFSENIEKHTRKLSLGSVDERERG